MKVRMLDGSGDRDYRYLYEDADRRGNIRVYFWRGKGHQKTRIKVAPGSSEFDKEYRQAFDGLPSAASRVKQPPGSPAAAGTFKWLCERYYTAPAFTGLDESTRRVRRRILENICLRVGNFAFKGMSPADVAKLRDEKAATPEAANSRVKALRQLFAFAVKPEYAITDRNPARDVEFLKSNNPDGHTPWTEVDAAKFEKRFPVGTKARLAFDLFVFTGVRISDVVKLGPPMERDGLLYFSETKGRTSGRKEHQLPILAPLRASISATPTGLHTYLVTEFGKPYAVKGFGNWFKRRCQEALGKDTKLSAHGIRKFAAIRCVEAGATTHELMAIFGWTSPKQVEVYTRKANRARLEAGAARLLEAKR